LGSAPGDNPGKCHDRGKKRAAQGGDIPTRSGDADLTERKPAAMAPGNEYG